MRSERRRRLRSKVGSSMFSYPEPARRRAARVRRVLPPATPRTATTLATTPAAPFPWLVPMTAPPMVPAPSPCVGCGPARVGTTTPAAQPTTILGLPVWGFATVLGGTIAFGAILWWANSE